MFILIIVILSELRVRRRVKVKIEIVKKLVSKLPHLFVAVIIRNKECIIKHRLLKDKKIAFEYKMKFDLFNQEQLSLEAIDYINSLQNKYHFSYISYYLNRDNQGALSGTEEADFKRLDIDYGGVDKLFFNNKWSVYSSSKEINWTKNYFKEVGIDFIFSPFILIEYFIKKEIKEGGMQLFLLYDKDSIALSIYYGQKFLYSNFFKNGKFEEGEEIELKDAIFEFLQISISNFYEGSFFESSFIERVVFFDNSGIDFKLIDRIENELFLPVDIKEISILDSMIELSKGEIIS